VTLLAALAVACFVAIGAPRPARAHEFRPALLDITDVGGGRFDVAWVPAPGVERAHPVFPPHCAREAAAPSDQRFFLACGPIGLAGQTISVVELTHARDDALVRLHLGGGVETSAVLSALRPHFVVPDPSGDRAPPATVTSYAVAGAAHLLTGPDHLLFLLGLLLLLRRPGPLVGAITAFTLAHSLSLALQVLGAVRLPPPPVEAAIALSLLLLARELLRPTAHPTLVQRRPWLVTFAFGLLHGLGFAGGLASLRVPSAQIPAALLGFNLGLEVAQSGLGLAALLLARLAAPSLARLPLWTHRVPAYSLGATATFWLLERTSTFWNS